MTSLDISNPKAYKPIHPRFRVEREFHQLETQYVEILIMRNQVAIHALLGQLRIAYGDLPKVLVLGSYLTRGIHYATRCDIWIPTTEAKSVTRGSFVLVYGFKPQTREVTS